MLGLDEKELSKTLDGFGALFSDIAEMKSQIQEMRELLCEMKEKQEQEAKE